ncbi:unnamed protein product [Brassica rapa]|uniref:Origin recognition complex subunit 5 C-terminal domain-containing protein n=3 Tax=Brassica TaxID=3705 RepID=A0A8D9CVM5_BRACM|nr:unnamed protein product [Brassica rapa]
MVYLIVDHLDLIKEWDKGAMILQFLFSLYSVLKLPQLGLILEVLDFHMSTSAKYLLIAGFLEARNPATLDASMFDSTGGIDNRKRKRTASEKSMEKKEIAEQEAAMKGPGSFPLERLLAIFQCIASIGDSSFNEEKKKLLFTTERITT